ncbi:3-hydroxyacyl-CoA dehydrogenase family protein [Bacteroidota bacterium]
MNYVDKLSNVTVLGAGGKMGSGIVLLTALEMARLKFLPENKNKCFALNAMDISPQNLEGLWEYLRTQITKVAEKSAVQLREQYRDNPSLVENYDIIDQYVKDVISVVRPVSRLEASYDSKLIFEAISENPELKVKILSEIWNNNNNSPYFFTNTSSVPIGELNKNAGLEGHILGFHFYNPPAVQRLVELIISDDTKDEVANFAKEYARNLRKTVVYSNDFAGFVGNGHFMRDLLYGIKEAERISEEIPFYEAVYAIDKITRDYLIRPMGIFQLIDYVGIDVCQFILQVMKPRLGEDDLHNAILDKYKESGILGGQNPDGSQKDGFLQYKKGRPTGIYDPDSKQYKNIEDFSKKIDTQLGDIPDSWKPWKAIIANPDKSYILDKYFSELKTISSQGGELARNYLLKSKEIGLKLVADKIAKTEDDVNTVMLTGFYHSYGPINNY